MRLQPVPPRAAEGFLIDQLCQGSLPTSESSALTTSLGRAQLSESLIGSASSSPSSSGANSTSRVDCWFIDQFQAGQAKRWHAQNASGVNIVCQADVPPGQYASAWLPLGRRGETEWVRDQIQSLFNAVDVGGHLIVAVNNPEDRWVHEQLQRLPCGIKRLGDEQCSGYVCKKSGPLLKQKNYRCEFALRHREHLLKLVSRPTVFSHRRVDPGARQLLNALPPAATPSRVLDIGCGAGTISVAAAAMYSQATVWGIDSNTRAVECTLASAAANRLDNVRAIVTDDGQIPNAGQFDLVLANPPYFADFRIAELFLQTALRALHPGGRLLLVGKDRSWYEQNMPEEFGTLEIESVKGYVIVSASLA